MRKNCTPILILTLIGAGAIPVTPAFGPHPRAAARVVPAISGEPQITGLQLMFKAQPVDHVTAGKKIKKYSIQVTGMGFVPDSTVIVRSVRAYPITIGEPPLQPVSSTFNDVTSMGASFVAAEAPPPGVLQVRVVNPEGAESNIFTTDVISKSSDLSIASISPESGPVGTQLTLTGTGFNVAGGPERSAIRFSPVSSTETFFEGLYFDTNSEGGRLSFTVPNGLILPLCPGIFLRCDPIDTPLVTPQQYRVWVINPNGMSNSILFQVTSSAVP